MPSRELAAVLAVVVLVVCGCTTVVAGRPQALAPPVTDVPEAELTVAGSGDGAIDVLARNALADLETFWAEQFPAVYGEPFEPLAGGYFSVDPDAIDAADYPQGVSCGAEPLEVEENAFYCDSATDPNSDSITYDRAFLGELAEEYGRFVPALVMAHEYGHAVQARVGFPEPSIAAETQADCLAGSWTAWVAAGEAEHTTIRAPELDQLLRGYLILRDPVGTSLHEVSAHGSYFDRVSAFQEGFADGVVACRDNFGLDRVYTQQSFSDADLATGGNAPYGELIDLVEVSLPEFWTAAFGELAAGPFEPPTLEPFDGTAPACAPAEADLVYCPEQDLAGYDEADLTHQAHREIGDFAVATALSIPYALGAREQLGLSTDGAEALRSAVCLTGTYAWIVSSGTSETVAISAGDIDESVSFLLEYGTDPRVLPDVGLTGFELVDVFRTGFVEGLGACGLTV